MSAPPSWQELHFTAKKEQVAALESWLFECGALAVTLEDDADQPLLEPGPGETPLWEAVSVTALFDGDRSLNSLIDAVPSHLVVTSEAQPMPVADREWTRVWEAQFHPMQMGERLWVCPSWTAPPDPAAVVPLQRHAGARAHQLTFTTFFAEKWHTAAKGACDLFIDTFPYSSHGTAADALYAGVPVVTLPGESMASRVGTSLSLAAGAGPTLIARNLADYRAVAHAAAAGRCRGRPRPPGLQPAIPVRARLSSVGIESRRTCSGRRARPPFTSGRSSAFSLRSLSRTPLSPLYLLFCAL